MFRLVFAAVVSLIVLTACGNGQDVAPSATVSPLPPIDSTAVRATSVAKPGTVPRTAQPVEETRTLGRIERRANEAPLAVMTRRFLDAACQDEVLLIETSEETIYAALPCGRFWDADTKEIFVGEEVALVLEVTKARFRVLIETLAGAQAEFTVAGIWVE